MRSQFIQLLMSLPVVAPARRRARAAGWGLALLGLAFTTPLQAEVTVETLAGGPLYLGGPCYGFADGKSLEQAQFNLPSGCVITSAGYLFVADRNNNSLRRLDVAGNRTMTVVTGLNEPVALALDLSSNLFIANYGNGQIVKYDKYKNLSTVATVSAPTALASDGSNTLYVVEFGGGVKRIAAGTGVVTPLATGLSQPGGVALLGSGLLAVTETAAHRIRLINATNGATVSYIGNGTSGFRDGAAATAMFNTPGQIFKSPDGGLVVADTMNHRLRYVGVDGAVITLCGIDPSRWEYGPEESGFYPGWSDGIVDYAEVRQPLGVCVADDGTVYDTETYYHLVRQTTGLEDVVASAAYEVYAPTISPSSGYYPGGVTITVTNPNSNLLLPTAVYYTTDGTEPTTNSLQVVMVDGKGVIEWQDATRDLSFLRIKAFVGNVGSETVGGTAPAVSEIGITGNLRGGPGAMIVVPVMVNLATNVALRSLQFRAEVAPVSAADPVVPADFKVLSVTNEPFIVFSGPAASGKTAQFSTLSYTNGSSRGLAVTFLGTNSGFEITAYGVVALLGVPIPPTASVGAQYELKVLQASATSDGMGTQVPLKLGGSGLITVTNISYLVGDTASATWYNAGDFGDGDLNNADVNNVFNAVLGGRKPFPFTDAFDAMDAYPLDSAGHVGGDGQLRYLDWQTILYRSLRLDQSNWRRTWSAGGVRVPATGTLPSAPSLPAERQSVVLSEPIWFRQATVGALPVANAMPNTEISVPVYVKVEPGCQLGGLMFRATITPEGWTTPLSQTVDFVPKAGYADPTTKSQSLPGEVLCAWAIQSMSPLQGSNVIGYLTFHLPYDFDKGQDLHVSFSHVDGAADMTTQYDLQSVSSTVWVMAPAQGAGDVISDEWKLNFFGDAASPAAAPDADADGDGYSNIVEYFSGTDPVVPDWHQKVEQGRFVVRWFGVSGQRYVVERSSDMADWSQAGEVTGEGRLSEYSEEAQSRKVQFYRVRPAP